MAYVGRLGTSVILCGLFSCGPAADLSRDGGNGSDATGGPCAAGATRCEGSSWLVCQNGEFVVDEVCPNVCVSGLGCTLCQPGTGTCSGNTSTMCNEAGSGYSDVFCDPLQGMACDFEIGVCGGACAPQNLGRAYIGCEYYPTVTGNEVDGSFSFAVAVSNTTSETASVHVEGGALPAPLTFTVAPKSVQVQTLPWVPALKACTSVGQLECGMPQSLSAMVVDGAYHLRSTQPVTVYQFNPLEYVIGFQNSYTNDASLLLPANAMTPNYFAAAWPVWQTGFIGDFPGLIAITATRDGTSVTVATTTTTHAGTGVPAFAPGVAQTLSLNAGDAVQLFAVVGDLTGSLVQADKPVQVLGGHYCTQIPFGITACDHVEESMFPYEALSNRYIVTAPTVPTLPGGKVEIIRIIATEPNTVLELDPVQPGVPTTLANTGDVIEIANNAESFEIFANHKILVAQYMEGQDAGGSTGDPAMALAVPVEQYRTEYQFHAPINYEISYVNVTAPLSAVITLDGSVTPLAGFSPIGATGYGLLRVTLAQSGNGNHTMSSNEPFGISVYGYGQYTSYWYPGGLDLSPITIE
jgi:hypothetical protein